MNLTSPKVASVPSLAEKVFVFDNFYEDVERVYHFSKLCPKRAYELAYIKGMESVLGYPSHAALERLKQVLGVEEIVDKTDEHSLFGIFRYLLAGDSPTQIGVHVDSQAWALIVYISPTVEAPATGIYRHRLTGVCDLAEIGSSERESFVQGPLEKDKYDAAAWERVYATPFTQNNAILFKAGDLLHSNVMTWGDDIGSARVTQNFNFQVR